MKSYQGQYAGIVSRLVALVIDLVLISSATIALTWTYTTVAAFAGINLAECSAYGDVIRVSICRAANIVLILFGAVLMPLYLAFFWLFGGQTIGKAVMGIRILRLDARPLNLTTVVRRLMGYGICFLTLGLGFVWALVDDRRQGFHDKVAGTCVVYSWKAE